MKINEVISILEELSPLSYSEGFDNTGLLVGNYNTEVKGILVTLDTLESIVDEAIKNNCNLIVSFHPIIFSGLKKLTGKNYVERVVIKAIKNNIAIFSGTVKMETEDFVFADTFSGLLTDPTLDRNIGFSYAIKPMNYME